MGSIRRAWRSFSSYICSVCTEPTDIAKSFYLTELSVAEGLSTTADLEQLQMKLLSLLGNSAVVVAAAANGDESVVKDFLTKNPQDVSRHSMFKKERGFSKAVH